MKQQRTADRRVVVTGLGVVAPCGVGVADFWAGLHRLPAPLVERRVEGTFGVEEWLKPVESRRLDRFAEFGVAAAGQALSEAGISDGPLPYDAVRCGSLIGTGIGGAGAFERAVRVLDAQGARRVSPYTGPMVMPNAAAAAVSLRWGLRGPSEALSTACASGTHAIGRAARMVAAGECDLMVAGGSEACLTDVNLASFGAVRALSRTGISRPFDIDRDGFCAAEGAGLLVLEERSAALARGAPILLEVAGTSSTCDAHHITAPHPEGVGAIDSMRLAIADAGLAPADIVHVNAHGTSTQLNDVAESRAIAAVLHSPDRDRPPVTSVKGVLGHALGAAGAIEAVAVALSVRHGLLPPTLGTTRVDPEVEIDVVLEQRRWSPGPVLSNSFGFGGHNGSLVLLPV
ncbi:MAG: beta-ketoacyl synthase [Pseudonocardiales bacterium]|nr:MAG: beta-ketoacyl synthase [Pseudonocardiales bacterium]